MKQLPNLKRIAVLDWFQNPDYLPFYWDNHEFEWYLRCSSKAHEGIALPTRWSEADCEDPEAHYKPINEFPWDFRGINNLLTAIEDGAPQLRHLSFGCQMSNLSPDILLRKGHTKLLRRIASQLISFKMDVRTSYTLLSSRATDLVASLRGMIKQAKHLENLTLNVAFEDWARIFNEVQLPKLKILDLGDGMLNSQDFKNMLHAHRYTLRQLRLRNMHIPDEIAWEDFARIVGQFLHLDLISLWSIVDATSYSIGDTAYLDVKRVEKAATNFMKPIPSHLLRKTVLETKAVMAWNIKTFEPGHDLATMLEQ